MRIISNQETMDVNGGVVQRVVITAKRMTAEEKAAYDKEWGVVAKGVDACAQGDIINCFFFLDSIWPDVDFNTNDQQNLIDWNFVSG
ncbi:MAG: hypothetical protein E6Q34_09525 [Burkholderiaceae bacterium]|nr:MAG: hypothetical protein E6Q34_09525 [Burkholderiaceae bacterium]